MPNNFRIKGVEWKAHENAFHATIGTAKIEVWQSVKGDYWFKCGRDISALPTATDIKEAAALAFDVAHLAASNLCNAFSDALVREGRDWFEGLEEKASDRGFGYKDCPCGDRLPLDMSDEMIARHFGHRGE